VEVGDEGAEPAHLRNPFWTLSRVQTPKPAHFSPIPSSFPGPRAAGRDGG
jgi:hypothetical protein